MPAAIATLGTLHALQLGAAAFAAIVADFDAWRAQHRELAVDLRAVPLSALEDDIVDDIRRHLGNAGYAVSRRGQPAQMAVENYW